MAEGYLYHRREPATVAQLLAQLAALTGDWNTHAYRYQERLDDVELDRGEKLEAGEALWPVGRVFCPVGEVRWETVKGGYAVQVVAEADPALPETEWEQTTFDRVDGEQPLYLWGERATDDAAWAETRIPRLLHYPVQWSQERTMAAVYGRAYRQNGVVRLTRLTRVGAIADPKDEERER